MMMLEIGIRVILWDKVSQLFQMTSVSLQSSGQDLNTAFALYESLYGYIQVICFSDIEQNAKDLTSVKIINNKLRKNTCRIVDGDDDFSGSSTLEPLVESQMPSQKFKIQTFLFIIYSLLSALSKCQEGSQKLNAFVFLYQLQSCTLEKIVKRLSNLLGEEFVQFDELLKTNLVSHIGTKQDPVEIQFNCLVTDNSLESCVPSVEIALLLMVTNCIGECSFPKLIKEHHGSKQIKQSHCN